MTHHNPSIQQKERRLRTRFQIPKSQDAKVTFWTQEAAGDAQNEVPEECRQGRLGNVCERGLQVILEAACWEQFRPNQRVMVQVDFRSGETDIQTETTGQLKYVVPNEQVDTMKVGIEFLESELDADTKRVIGQIIELAGPCPESKFDKCPNL